MMDLGATICTPVAPGCGVCPWLSDCGARAAGDAEAFPRRPEKRAGKLRRGAAFVVVREDHSILVRSRPPNGLLGGMTELPTTEWSAAFDETNALDVGPHPTSATANEKATTTDARFAKEAVFMISLI